MTGSFDPRPALAAYLHPKVCPAHATLIAAADCLDLPAAIDAYQSALAEAGLAIVPAPAVKFIARLFADATEADVAPEHAPESGSEARALATTWLVSTLVSGAVRREGPYTRAWGEILLGDLNFTHGEEVVSARLEGEMAWMSDLGTLLEDWNGPWVA